MPTSGSISATITLATGSIASPAARTPICTAEIGARSAAICHLANIGYGLRRPLKWDPAKEEFPADSEANKLLDYEMRAPWKL